MRRSGHGELRRVAALIGDDDEHHEELDLPFSPRSGRAGGAEGSWRGGGGGWGKVSSRLGGNRMGEAEVEEAPGSRILKQQHVREQQHRRQPRTKVRRQQSFTVVAAVIENRAKEVGLALFDKEGGPSLTLEQHIESGTSYSTLLCELQEAQPGVILTLGEGASVGEEDCFRFYVRREKNRPSLLSLK